MPGAAEQPHRAVAAAVAAAVGEELDLAGAEAVSREGAAAGPDTAGGQLRGSARERAGLRRAGLGQDALAVCHRPGTGAVRAEGAVLDVRAASAGITARQARAEAEPG